MILSQTQKSAIVLMTLGEDLAAQVLRYLSTKEVQQISRSMVSMPQLSQEQLKNVLDDCQKTMEECAIFNINTNDYLRSILEKSIGGEKASRLLDDLLAHHDEDTSNGLDMLNYVDASTAVDLVTVSYTHLTLPTICSV